MKKNSIEEEWRPIPEWEGYYEASSYGRVRSVDRSVMRGAVEAVIRGKILKQHLRRSGYLFVNLCRDGRYKSTAVHRLVLMAFKGAAPEGYICCHNDGVRNNNHLANLRWGTYSENLHDKVKHGTDHQAKKTHCPRNHVLDGDNLVKAKARGNRECLACNRARAYMRYNGINMSKLQEVSDSYYADIVKSVQVLNT